MQDEDHTRVAVTVRLSTADIEKVDKIAALTGSTRSGALRMLVRQSPRALRLPYEPSPTGDC
jgi:hypothetical protein